MRVSCCEQARALGRHVSVHVDMKRDKSQKDEAPVFPAQRFSEEAPKSICKTCHVSGDVAPTWTQDVSRLA